MGQYIKPIYENFLNLSGGTVTGDTLFLSTISATTIYSGNTNLYDIFLTSSDGNDITRVQNGLNIYTGGTNNYPTINISSATLNSLNVSGDSILNNLNVNSILLSAGTFNNPFIKVASGELLVQSLPGAIEFSGDNYYVGISSPNFNSYISQFPINLSNDYVKATSQSVCGGTIQYAYNVLDSNKSLVGSSLNNSWIAESNTHQRLHIDLGEEKIITRIYYENGHDFGTLTENGVQYYNLYGSNDLSSFEELDFNIDDGWNVINCDSSKFLIHISQDVSDPKYIYTISPQSYRYFCFKFYDSYSNDGVMFLRKLELQTGNTNYRKGIILDDGVSLKYNKIPVSTNEGRLIDSIISQIDNSNINVNGNINAFLFSGNVYSSILSAATIYSANTNLYDIFLTSLDGSDITRVQNGLLNILIHLLLKH